MGVINITQRSERLGNLGGTSAAHGVTSTDIGTVHHTTARTFSPHYYSRNAHAGDAALGRGLERVGDTMLNIALAVRQREEDRQVDEYTNAMMRTMETESRDDREITDWNTPQRQHLQGQKRGFYLRTGEGTMNVAQEWDDCFGERFKQIGTSIGANERVRERTMKNLAGYRRGVISRLMDQQASEYRRMELGAAQGTLDTQVNLFNSGNDAAIPDIFKQYDRVSMLRRLTPEQAKAGKEELALKLAASVVGRRVAGCQTAEDFDRVEADVKAGMKDRLPDEIAANLPGGERTVGGKMKDALLTDVRRAKRTFLAEKDAAERENHQAVLRKFTEKELAIRDVPQELWADAYEALGNDEELKKTDPKRAMVYLDTARDMRKATVSKRVAEKELAIRDMQPEQWATAYEELGRDKELRDTNPALAMSFLDTAHRMREKTVKEMADAAKAAAKAIDDAAKAQIKANEDGLAGALCQLQMLELEGALPQDQANEAQAAIWRKFRTCALGRTVSPGFMHTFMSRMQTRLSDQEANAMRKFYRAFGYSPELQSDGDASTTERNAAKKDSTAYYAPLEADGTRIESRETRIKAIDLLRYGDSLLMTLRALGPEMNREGVVEREIERIRTSWMKGEIDRNRDATVRSIMDIQREARARWIAEQEETTTKEGKDDGNKGEQGATK